MRNFERTTKIPTTMTMTINAIWNEKEEKWEVSIFEIGTSICAKTNEPMYEQITTNIEIADECDEYVIPIAILEHNGIDTTKLRFDFI